MTENRFSVLLLEKDVLEYIHCREKYQQHEGKEFSLMHYFRRTYHHEKKIEWYGKYIKKMHYLEKNYRKTNVFTSYHEQLEGPNHVSAPPTVFATLIEPTAPYPQESP